MNWRVVVLWQQLTLILNVFVHQEVQVAIWNGTGVFGVLTSSQNSNERLTVMTLNSLDNYRPPTIWMESLARLFSDIMPVKRHSVGNLKIKFFLFWEISSHAIFISRVHMHLLVERTCIWPHTKRLILYIFVSHEVWKGLEWKNLSSCKTNQTVLLFTSRCSLLRFLLPLCKISEHDLRIGIFLRGDSFNFLPELFLRFPWFLTYFG